MGSEHALESHLWNGLDRVASRTNIEDGEMSSPPVESATYFEQWQKLVPSGGFMHDAAHVNHPARITYTKLIADVSKTVLDVGCGISVDHPRFRDAGVEYFGLDVTPAYLKIGQLTGIPKDHLFLGNVLSLPFPDSYFDSVYSNGMLEHLPPDTWKQAIREMFRVCRKQALLIFFIPLVKGSTIYLPQAAWPIFWGHAYGEDDLRIFFSQLGATVKILEPINSLAAHYPPETIIVAKKNI